MLIQYANEKDTFIIRGDLNKYVGKEVNAAHEGIHGGYVYGVRNTDGEAILEMGAAFDKVV